MDSSETRGVIRCLDFVEKDDLVGLCLRAGRGSFVCTCLRHSKRQTVHLFAKKGCEQAEAWSDRQKKFIV